MDRLPASQEWGVAAMTVAGSTRQEGAALDISPAALVVPFRQEVVWVSNVC